MIARVVMRALLAAWTILALAGAIDVKLIADTFSMIGNAAQAIAPSLGNAAGSAADKQRGT
jgi:hypothetical protein